MYTLLGANGNITSKIARILLADNKPVRVLGRDASRLVGLSRLGAQTSIGDIADADFLSSALRDSTAAFLMLPPCYGAVDPLKAYARLGESIVRAVQAAGLRQVVNLSSIGAHLSAGTGPIVSLHDQEQRLNALNDLAVLHLRPGAFFENHYNAIGTIQALGAYCDLIAPDAAIPAISTHDIATVAARELVGSAGAGTKRVLHLHGPRFYTPVQAARILGAAIGRPELQYIQGDPAQIKGAMVQYGLSPAMADLLEEMCAAFARPALSSALAVGPTEATPTSLESFASEFARAYGAQAKLAAVN